jgi:deoxyribodipyrimidine photo-lyase
MHTMSLHWFRADLRYNDNTALSKALSESNRVIACFILTPKTWKQHHKSASQVQFILDNLQALEKILEKNGIPLLIRSTDYFEGCAAILYEIMEKYRLKNLYFNAQYEIDEIKRDTQVTQYLHTKNRIVKSFADQTILAPGRVLSKAGTPFKIFTPFKNTWLKNLQNSGFFSMIPSGRQTKNPVQDKTSASEANLIRLSSDPIPTQCAHFISPIDTHSLWPAGEIHAAKRLETFCESTLDNYHLTRNKPGIPGTSCLSPYLALGVLSPRQCLQAILKSCQTDNILEIQDKLGPATWLSELIWREFYKHLMAEFPSVCCFKPFQVLTDKLPWRQDKIAFERWCQGLTGFPLIDAAMRQLLSTGWMHNRLRMLVANFLTKSLFIDWRWGERYFMQQLIDGDLSANNGNWQWSASTGTDAAPYFRIFNPIRQSNLFDPSGDFIRRYCKELACMDNKAIHEPHRLAPALAKKQGYPEPMITLGENREAVLHAFKTLKDYAAKD